MKFDRLIVCGESYMEPFTASGGHLELARRLNIPQVDVLVFPGSAIDQIIRKLTPALLSTQDRCLVIWGLTFVSRFDVLLSMDNGYNTGVWASFNGYNFNAIDPSEIVDYEEMLAATRSLEGPRSVNYDEILSEYLNKVINMICTMRHLRHGYIIYSQCGILTFKEENLEKVQVKWLQQDPRCLDIFDFSMNQHLQRLGAPILEEDIIRYPHLDRGLAHLQQGDLLVSLLSDLLENKCKELFGDEE